VRFFVIAINSVESRLAFQYTGSDKDTHAVILAEFHGPTAEVEAFARRLNDAVATWPVTARSRE
jgi:hypothetical protein